MTSKRRKVALDKVYPTVSETLFKILDKKGTVTADDIHAVLEIPSAGMKVMPQVFRNLQRQGVIAMTDIVCSCRKDQKANRIGYWRRT